MKKILLILLFIPVFSFAQKKDYKNFDRAVKYNLKGDIQKAIKYAHKALENTPDWNQPALLLSSIYANNNQINQSLLREQMLQSQVEKSNQSLDDLLKLEEQFDSTNVPVKIIVTPSDIEEYYRLKLKRIRDDIIGLNMIETLLDTAGAIKYYGYDYFEWE